MQGMGVPQEEGLVLMRVHYNTGEQVDISKLDKVTRTFYLFGYSVRDATSLSKQVKANLDNYARQYDLAQERHMRSVSRTAKNPTQTCLLYTSDAADE